MMNNTMIYESYTARIEFDPRDNIFVGRVPGIVDIISFHSETVTELTEDFHNATPHHLADCKETGWHLKKPLPEKFCFTWRRPCMLRRPSRPKPLEKNLHQWASEVLERAADHRRFL